ncbi:hypothetical protein [Clostridium cuniculi]|uniref:hypothetical protein n=1 Tax=Clostridium cuniculi TaxID=2548455 RepID=UPI00140FD594|nr:hypothetical protein [Clostridium cuniculi]
MLKSIENVSKELGISKAAIYRKLKSEEYKKYVVKENGKMMLNEILLEKLKLNTRKKKVENIKEVEIVENKELEVINKKYKDDKSEVVEILLNQIKEKNAQIDRLHDLIENNQVLIKNQQEREKEQLKLEEHFREIDKKLIEIRDKKEVKEKRFLGIFKVKS